MGIIKIKDYELKKIFHPPLLRKESGLGGELGDFMSELKVSVSGIRGIWADSLTLESLKDYTQAFGKYILKRGGKKILMGRDARPTGSLISGYTASILNAMGIDVLDCGIVPTPTVLFGIRKLGLDGGLIITASHNPVEWNALKFVKKNGTFTGEADVEEIKSYLTDYIKEASYNQIGSNLKEDSVAGLHIDEIIKNINVSAIQKKSFKVVLDPVNSAGSLIGRNLLERLGCHVVVVNGEMTGRFERGAEPTPVNLKHLENIIRENKANIGFAQDPDADRLVVIDETRRVLSEEYTLALAVENVLSKTKGDIVINLSTSMLSEEIAKRHGCRCYRTKVGEANVVEGIEIHKALIGGEGNGGVIYPRINMARDSLVGMALILELMAETGKKLSEILAAFPAFIMVKEKYDFKGDFEELFKNLKKELSNSIINELDGIRFDWDENGIPVWVHIRASNTEPVIRVIGESSDKNLLEDVLKRIRLLI